MGGALAALAEGLTRALRVPAALGVLTLLAVGAVSAWFACSNLTRGRAAGRAPPPGAGQQVRAEVRARTDAMTSSIEQLSAEANSIAFICTLQTGNSEAARESMNEMSGSISRVATLAEQTEERSRHVTELAAEGEARAQAAVADLDRLSSSFGRIEDRVRTLIDHAREIGVAAELINKIASQTKLLSLNATIEAVRAGDQGSGFAVVAEEVRKLADGSSVASREISTAVTSIREGTEAVAGGIEEASDAVREGLAHLSRTLELLGPIRREADDTLQQNREVTTALTAEADLTTSAVESMAQVLELSGETESLVNQALATTTTLAQLTDEILATVTAGAADAATVPSTPEDPPM